MLGEIAHNPIFVVTGGVALIACGAWFVAFRRRGWPWIASATQITVHDATPFARKGIVRISASGREYLYTGTTSNALLNVRARPRVVSAFIAASALGMLAGCLAFVGLSLLLGLLGG